MGLPGDTYRMTLNADGTVAAQSVSRDYYSGDNETWTEYQTLINNNHSKDYTFTYNAPEVLLKEREYNGKEIVGGKTRTLTVYKLTKKKYSQKYLLINGKQYMGAVGDGIDLK